MGTIVTKYGLFQNGLNPLIYKAFSHFLRKIPYYYYNYLIYYYYFLKAAKIASAFENYRNGETKKGTANMKETIKKIKISELKILTGTTYLYDRRGGEYKFYIGVLDEYGSACRLSKYFDTWIEASKAMEEGEFKTRVIVREYENGLKLYYPAED